jgi:hypothetical protein
MRRPVSRTPHAIAAACALLLAAAPLQAAPEARAEVQINLCAASDVVVRALNLRPAESFESWYFESPGRVHNKRGYVFRLRTGGSGPQLTLKVAGQDCAKVKPELLESSDAKCEYDLHGAKPAGAVSITRSLSPELSRALVDGKAALADLLSPAQVRYLEATGGWPLASDIKRLGPVRVRAYRTTAQKFVVEAWTLPGDERFVEISQKTPLTSAAALQADLEAMLDRASVPRCADQSSQAAAKLDAMLARR